jgi:hypothetical protein
MLCHGVFRYALGPSDWIECYACGATGITDVRIFGDCDGNGWHYIRA